MVLANSDLYVPPAMAICVHTLGLYRLLLRTSVGNRENGLVLKMFSRSLSPVKR